MAEFGHSEQSEGDILGLLCPHDWRYDRMWRWWDCQKCPAWLEEQEMASPDKPLWWVKVRAIGRWREKVERLGPNLSDVRVKRMQLRRQSAEMERQRQLSRLEARRLLFQLHTTSGSR